MTFGPRSYVPVLKVKRAEKAALASISPTLKPQVVPLLEIVQRTIKPVSGHLTTAFKGLSQSLVGYSRCFLDARELEPDGQQAAQETFATSHAEGIPFTPVTGISRTVDVSPAIAYAMTHGIALRLTDSDFRSGNLAFRLNSFLSSHGFPPPIVDLIVDLGDVGDLIPPGVIQKTRDFLNEVPSKAQWRTLTVTASAFPISMGGIGRNSAKRVTRTEWIAWRDGLHPGRSTVERLPSFSDCAIQHPIGVEGFDPTYMKASPTIRYALGDEWLLVKGESTKSSLASDQFPDLAMQVAYGPYSSDYQGTNHCHGCKLIQDSANGTPRLGSPEVWRKIGTIHHITTVVSDGLGSLQWP